MIGIDYNLFWTLNPSKIKPFIRAFELKEKRKSSEMDTLAWDIGSYVLQALGAMLDSNTHYPHEPNIYSKLMTDEERQEQLERENKEYMANFAKKYNLQ